MDDFKRETQDMITGWDLTAPVKYRHKTRRGLNDMARRRARRKLKQDLNEVIEIIERFNAHEKLYEQQRGKVAK